MNINYRAALAIILIVLAAASANCVSGGQSGTINNSSDSHSSVSPAIAITPTATVEPTTGPDDNASIEPTRIDITAESRNILAYGENDRIRVQLVCKGEPLRREGANITFTSDNDAIATFFGHRYNYTDPSGSTYLLLFSNLTPGRVKVTAFYNGSNGVISNSTYVDVSNWGGIGGLVFDKNGVGIPNANVSLWTCHPNDSSHRMEKGDKLNIPENPQLTNDGRTAPSGQYVFYRVPAGTYAVEADKNGHTNLSYVTLAPEDGIYSSGTCFITLADYTLDQPGYTPLALPTPTLNGGMIWGVVSDQNKVSIPRANISLWYCEYNAMKKEWNKTTMVDLPDNPQISNGGKTGLVGEYQFENLSQGTYYILAEFEGFNAHAIVRLNSNLAAADVILQGFIIEFPPLYPSPTPQANRT